MSTPRGLQPSDIARLRFIRGGQLSSDGRYAAYAVSRCDIQRNREFCEIRIRDLATDEDLALRTGAVFATHPRWAPEQQRLAYTVEEEGTSKVEIYEITTRSSRTIELPEGQLTGPAVWSPDGKKLAAVISRRGRRPGPRRLDSRLYRADGLGFFDDLRQELVLIDAESGAVAPCRCALGTLTYIEWDPSGTRMLILATPAAVPFASYSPHLYLLELRTGEAREVLTEGWFITHARWIPGVQKIAVVGACNSDLTIPDAGLWTIDPDGTHPSCRTEELCGSVGLRMHHDMPIWDIATNYGLVVPGADFAYATVQSRGAAAVCAISLQGERSVRPLISGERACVLLDTAGGPERLLFAASDIRHPTELYLADLRAGYRERRLTALNDEALANHCETEFGSLPIRSADGLELEGWFLRPKEPRPAPTVLFIHGGPFSSTGHMFRFDFHLLATNGFAVVFHNFRGSSGYGPAFSRAIMGDWGARGFPDHMAAADAAVAAGVADPSRLGVWGASHGGFATCWIVGHTERFRAAIAEAAVTNFTTAYYLSDAPDAFARDLGGRPDEIPDVYRSRSPITYAPRCVTPTLLLHGEDDLRCPIEEAEQFHRALLDAGCAAELMRIDGANHLGDSSGPVSARIEQNDALISWFGKHLRQNAGA